MSKILIVNYFINNNYNSIQKIKQWIDNIQKYYLVDCYRTIIIYTDNLEIKNIQNLYDNVEIRQCFKFVQNDSNLTNRYMKMLYILDALQNNTNIDYISFLQSNARCTQFIYKNDIINTNKLLSINTHYWFKNNFNILYKINNGMCNIKNKNTAKWIYCQTNHFVGKPEIIYNIAITILTWQLYDMTHNYISNITADEGYFNYYLNNVININNINCLNKNLFNNIYPNNCKLYFINKQENFWKTL